MKSMPTSPAPAGTPEVTVLPVTTRALLCAAAGAVAAIVVALVGPWWLIPIAA